MPHSKSSLRKHFLQIRKNITENEAKEAAIAAADNFIHNINLEGIKTIAFYYPIKGEISPLPLLERLSENKDIISLLPAVSGDNMLFYLWKLGDELVKNDKYSSLLEPAEQENPIIPEMIIVPLVAFDENCHRLGYGAGFYDKTLSKLREKGEGKRGQSNSFFFSSLHSPLTIGYAYEAQKSEKLLPVEQNDVALKFIVTNNSLYTVS